MAEDHHPRLHSKSCGEGLGDRDYASGTRAFRNHHDSGPFAAAMAVLDAVADVVEAERNLGDDDGFGAAAERNRERDKARVAAHHLNTEDAFVRKGRIADAVDRLERGVDRGVEADRVVGAGDVVVDRGRDDEDRNAGLAAEERRTDHRAFAADYYQRLDLMTPQVAGREAARGGRTELGRSRSLEESAAALNHVGDGASAERLGKIADEALVAAPEADDLDSCHRRATDHRAYRGVHPGRIAAGGKNRDSTRSRAGQLRSFVIAVAVHREGRSDFTAGRLKLQI